MPVGRFRDYAGRSLREGSDARRRRRTRERGRQPARDKKSSSTPTRDRTVQTEDLTNVPTTKLTGDVKKAGYSGAGIAGIVRDTPTALITPALKQLGFGQFGGLGDLLATMATPDQLDTLFALSNASEGKFGGGPNDQGNFFIDFYKGLAGTRGLPSPRQLLGGVFDKGATKPGNPFYGLVTGGTPAQQLAQFTNVVGDVGRLAGLNPLVSRALGSSLNARGRTYLSDQGQVKGGNEAFVKYLQDKMPDIASFFGAGRGGGNDGGGGGGRPGGGRPGGGGGRPGGGGGGGGGGQGGRDRPVTAEGGRGGRGMPQRGGRFADYRQRAQGRGGGRPDRGGGRDDGVAQRAIRDVFRGNPNIDRGAARRAMRGSAGVGGRDGGRSSTSASGGTVRLGNIDPGAKLTINASAGRAYSGPGRDRASGGGRADTGELRKTTTSVGGREPGEALGAPQPRKDFQTWSSMNTPYTRPAPRYDIPGYQRAAEDWSRQTSSVLDGRTLAWNQATRDYQDNLSAYERALQQIQQARVANPLSADFEMYRQRSY